MALYVDNYTSTISNCSLCTLMTSTYNSTVCQISFYFQAIVICIILPLNIWTLLLMTKANTTNRSSTPSDLLHFNVIFASVIFCIGLALKCLFIIYISNIYLYYGSAYIRIISLIAQTQFHTWIFLENYLAVVHPIFYLKLKQFRYKMVWVSFTWVTATAFGGTGIFVQKTIATLVYIIPVSGMIVLILFCGMATLSALKKPNPGDGERGKKMHHRKLKAFRIITLTLVVLIVSYSPYICFNIIWQQIRPELICTAQTIVNALLFPGFVVQSFLYISRFFKAQGP
ncbi:hypothetical protein Q7C36_004593 [Tachysurus vachellii]|uniref:G-protein coupled receptors family 1 profile domain-containing protein n=1 Tax=Tachysurus vachellii TaxID=175792 RepID=A0AA88NPH7_TACVA|nr:hypothetical protein Q7C36_004593 [Tachysurus vachellii]